MKLRGTVQDVRTIGASDRGAMFNLMEQNYGNMRRERFDSDLVAKQWVILLRRKYDGCIVGFSTQAMLSQIVGGRCVYALYSGDTVVDRGHWGDPALGHTWGNFALELIDRHPTECGPLYWFLPSKGFRTYHYLPLFFQRYFPSRDGATPAWGQTLSDGFGQLVGRNRYQRSRAIIRAECGSEFVRPGIAGLSAKRKTNPRVRFFMERNPGCEHGDEL